MLNILKIGIWQIAGIKDSPGTEKTRTHYAKYSHFQNNYHIQNHYVKVLGIRFLCDSEITKKKW